MTDPLTGYLRVKSVCLFINDGRILAIGDFDPTKQQSFWVPVGGRVEFRETSAHAIKREVREELAQEISDIELLGVLENIFEFDGDDAHEVIFVYDARFEDLSLYDQPHVSGVEGDKPFAAHWIDPHSPNNGWPLYPEGLSDVLDSPPA